MKTKVRERSVEKSTRRTGHSLTSYARRLSKNRLYDLMGALRGPDDYSSDAFCLKRLVTARVRSVLFGPGRPKADVNWVSMPLESEDIWGLGKVVCRLRAGGPMKHYVGHLRVAVEASAGHRVWGGHAKALLKALRGK